MKRKTIFNIVGTVTIVFTMVVLVKIAGTDFSDNIPQREVNQELSEFPLKAHLTVDSTKDIFITFPYKLYLDSANLCNINAIRNDLAAMDSVNDNQRSNRITLSHALTKGRAELINKKYTEFQPDSLLILMQWAEQFDYYAQFDADNDVFYRSVYTYWFNFVTSKLEEYSKENPSLKYDFRFKYLANRCKEKKFNAALEVPSTEKVWENLLYNKWGHLWEASWNQSSWLQKIAVMLILSCTFFGFLSFAKLLFRAKKNKL
jgi:hypothetical protein